ncbi:MAG: hypothetical protein IPI67_18475 [Myxococcales bacterium]|nr:hypothetical protein [Myxococcales bacterium]
MSQAWVALALAALMFGGLGCSGGKDPKIPGDELGTYAVVSTLQTSTCGPGALGSKDLWQFQVKLSQEGHDLYWLNGAEAIAGDLAADGVSFGFDSHVVVNAIAAGKGQPGCAISRIDTGSGRLSSSAPGRELRGHTPLWVPAFGGLRLHTPHGRRRWFPHPALRDDLRHDGQSQAGLS